MAIESEIERLVVRLTGDNKDYKKMLHNSTVETQRFVDKGGKLHDKLTGKFVAGQKRIRSSLEITGTALKKFGSGMTSLGRTMSMRVTAPIIAFGTASVYSFGKFDKAMTESLSIMKVTEDQARRMSGLALGMSYSGDALQGPTDLAKSYFYLASAGKDAEQSMALLPKVSKFATAGAFDMALATDLLTDAQSALGLSSKDAIKDAENMARLSDILVGANTLANASVQQFSVALTSKAGAAFKSYNIKLEEGVALLAAYADQGIKAELAGNAADRMIRLLTKAARDNASEFKRMNVRVFDASGEFRSFKNIIGDMERALKDMSTQEKSAALEAMGFQARVQSVILPLLGTSEAIGEYAEKLGDMAGITDEVANKQMKAFANRMKAVWNQVQVVSIGIGKLLVPYIEKLAETLQAGLAIWKGWSDGTKKTVVAVTLLIAALGPLLIGAGSLSFFAGQIILVSKKLIVLRASMLASAAGAITLKVALFGLIGLGFGVFIAGAVLELQKLINKLDEARERTTRMKSSRITSIEKLKEAAEQETDPGKKAEKTALYRESMKRETEGRLHEYKNAQDRLNKEKEKYGQHKDKAFSLMGMARSVARSVGRFFGAADSTKELDDEVKASKDRMTEWNDWLKKNGKESKNEGKEMALGWFQGWADTLGRIGKDKARDPKLAQENIMKRLRGEKYTSKKDYQQLGKQAEGAARVGIGLGRSIFSGAMEPLETLKNAAKGAASAGAASAKAYYDAWRIEQENSAKKRFKKEKERLQKESQIKRDVESIIERNLTPKERYDKSMDALRKLKPHMPEGAYLDEAARLKKELESIRPEIKLRFRLDDAVAAGSAEAEARLAEYMAGRGRKEGIPGQPMPSNVKDLTAPKAMGVGGVPRVKDFDPIQKPTVFESKLQTGKLPMDLQLPKIAEGIQQLVIINQQQLDKEAIEIGTVDL